MRTLDSSSFDINDHPQFFELESILTTLQIAVYPYPFLLKNKASLRLDILKQQNPYTPSY